MNLFTILDLSIGKVCMIARFSEGCMFLVKNFNDEMIPSVLSYDLWHIYHAERTIACLVFIIYNFA